MFVFVISVSVQILTNYSILVLLQVFIGSIIFLQDSICNFLAFFKLCEQQIYKVIEKQPAIIKKTIVILYNKVFFNYMYKPIFFLVFFKYKSYFLT